MKPVQRLARHSGPLYAVGMTVACVAVVVLAIAGTPSH